jgi:hypothetical protein
MYLALKKNIFAPPGTKHICHHFAELFCGYVLCPEERKCFFYVPFLTPFYVPFLTHLILRIISAVLSSYSLSKCRKPVKYQKSF